MLGTLVLTFVIVVGAAVCVSTFMLGFMWLIIKFTGFITGG